MRIIVSNDPDSVVQEAADIVERFVSTSESLALGLATGETMEGLFAELVSRYRRQGLSFRVFCAGPGDDSGHCHDPCRVRTAASGLWSG